MDTDLIKELAEALREAIGKLNGGCEECWGEGFNQPRWNDLLAKADSRLAAVQSSATDEVVQKEPLPDQEYFPNGVKTLGGRATDDPARRRHPHLFRRRPDRFGCECDFSLGGGPVVAIECTKHHGAVR